MTKSRRTYTAEFRREAVELVTRQGLTVAEAARRLGVHVNLLRNWKQNFESNGSVASATQPSAIEAECARLRAENERLPRLMPTNSASNAAHVTKKIRIRFWRSFFASIAPKVK